MPGLLLLISVGDIQDERFLQRVPDQLQADGQPGAVEAAGDRKPATGAQIDRQRKDIGQIHAHGIVGPVTAGPLIGAAHGRLWVVVVVGGCLTASVLALSLRRLLTTTQDGRVTPGSATVPEPVSA